MLPDIGVFHPQVVHFVIALLIVGVIFRLVSLTGKWTFTGPAAAVLLLAGTLAAVVAVHSGHQAHEFVERIPGIRPVISEHEEWGEGTRNLFLGIAALEIIAFVVRRKAWHRYLLIGSAVAGVVGVWFIYQTGKHGGEIVYEYAGGVGTRSGNPADIDHLLLAGLFEKATLDRKEGRAADAAVLFDELNQRYGDDPMVRFLAIQSQLVDRHDTAAALTALGQFPVPPDNALIAYRVGSLHADVFEALGQPDSARAVLQALVAQFPNNRRLEDRLSRLK